MEFIRICKITALLLFLLAGLGACDDALDKLPLDAPSDETFYTNETELEMAVTGAYRSLYWVSDVPFPVLLDNTTDLGFLRSDFSSMQTFSRGAHSPAEPGFSDVWEKMYTGIGRCNNLLNNMEKAREVVSDDTYRRIEAEALFLRAYYYSWLLQLYGDVPFMEEVPAAIEDAYIPKTPRTEIVQRLLEDLDKVAEILPENWGDSDEGRATKGAALTLKARIALYDGLFGEAAEAAFQVMNSGTYKLHPDYGELFTYAGVRVEEVIFDLPFQLGFMTTRLPLQLGPRNTGSWSQIVPSQFMVDSYECADGNPIDRSSLYDPAQPFENRDPRLDASLVRPQSVFAGYVFETHPDSTETTYFKDGVATRVANQDVRNAFATFTGYLWRKYAAPEDMPQNAHTSGLSFILMRYAEVLLIYAEAKTELGQADATVLDAVNQVRARAYGVDVGDTGNYPAVTTTNQDELRTIIRRERKVELANEGFRLTDIRRWKIAEHVMPGIFAGRPRGAYSNMTFVPEIDRYGHPNYNGSQDLYRSVDQRIFNPGRDYLWPIPQKDMDVNPALEQNPGY
ncbi:RagB/SusD family nutrient uptake outer membrane protein [Sinomicrobium weinanense]|uniref:RagB/SusD family nutrient uptake outer membrane protein n=1 Tax=Sinomicrobium weinanense TaxID=2842200 RepID=A0A926JTZ6_9FLAO|nr:RagB/SusD family nutrient uptake outer membrane protein [Sinomicrobium weinanense]MBC9797151.1 RagB/SusD family nutrient uptake outer membrane protein [Sinomicrobium weinanense]MBU3124492.1 RagB/SusD family nutrient uptake outer membrane protein [Sinomicrobium weinanense]